MSHKRRLTIAYLVALGAAGLLILVSEPKSGILESPLLLLPIPRAYLPVVMRLWDSNKGVGLSYSDEDWTCSAMQQLGITWYYNWSRQTTLNCTVPHVGMLWNLAAVGKPINSPIVMGFNECDISSQCNATPTAAATAWYTVEQVYAGKFLVAPVPSHLNLGWLTKWRTSFISQFGRLPQIDALAAHCYGTIEFCKNHIGQTIALADSWGIQEVWVTEFGYPQALYGEAYTIRFMKEMMEWFDQQPKITRYAWFALSYRGDEWWAMGPASNTSLFNYFTHEKTTLGYTYEGD